MESFELQNLTHKGPVQFEKDGDDLFGIDKLLTDAKRGSKRGGESDKSEKSKRRKDYD